MWVIWRNTCSACKKDFNPNTTMFTHTYERERGREIEKEERRRKERRVGVEGGAAGG